MRSRREWIDKARSSFRFSSERLFENGDVFYLWGRELILKVRKAIKFHVRRNGNIFLWSARRMLEWNIRKEPLLSFFWSGLRAALHAAIKRREDMTGIKAFEYRLRIMKSR